jgi:hypothetical protein
MGNNFYIVPYDPIFWAEPNNEDKEPSSNLQINPADYEQKLKNKFPH